MSTRFCSQEFGLPYLTSVKCWAFHWAIQKWKPSCLSQHSRQHVKISLSNFRLKFRVSSIWQFIYQRFSSIRTCGLAWVVQSSWSHKVTVSRHMVTVQVQQPEKAEIPCSHFTLSSCWPFKLCVKFKLSCTVTEPVRHTGHSGSGPSQLQLGLGTGSLREPGGRSTDITIQVRIMRQASSERSQAMLIWMSVTEEHQAPGRELWRGPQGPGPPRLLWTDKSTCTPFIFFKTGQWRSRAVAIWRLKPENFQSYMTILRSLKFKHLSTSRTGGSEAASTPAARPPARPLALTLTCRGILVVCAGQARTRREEIMASTPS